jgi:hypothetical protein
VPALEPIEAWRVVALPSALDGARWRGEAIEILRVAPDEALGLGAAAVEVDDPDAIVEPEAGFSTALLSPTELARVLDHVEWEVPDVPRGGMDRTLLQGKVAGVPAKLSLGEPAILVVQTCYVDDLRARLGW